MSGSQCSKVLNLAIRLIPALSVMLAMAVLFAGCATPDTKSFGIVSERTFRGRVLKRYESDPTFPLYTLYVGVVQDANGRVTRI